MKVTGRPGSEGFSDEVTATVTIASVMVSVAVTDTDVV